MTQPLFEHESGITIYAPIGKALVLSGDNYDCVTRFLEALQEAPEYDEHCVTAPTFAMEDCEHSYWDTNEAEELKCELVDALDFYAPEGYRFRKPKIGTQPLTDGHNMETGRTHETWGYLPVKQDTQEIIILRIPEIARK